MTFSKIILILKSLFKRRLATILTILQLSICTFSFLILIQFNKYYYTRGNLYNSIIDVNRTLVIDRSSYNSDNFSKIKDELNDLIKLKNNGYISEIRVLSKGGSLRVNNTYYPYYQASEGFFLKLNIKMDKGRMFNHEELTQLGPFEEIPIIIGHNLGKVLKIGDTLEETYKYNDSEITGEYKKVFKVIGIAKPSSLITLPANATIFDIFINDNAIYAPLSVWKYYLTDKTKNKSYINRSISNQKKYNLKYEVNNDKIVLYNDEFISSILNMDFQIITNENKNIDTIKQICNNVSKKNGSNLKFIKLQDKNKPIIELLNQSFIGILVFSIILFLFSITGIIGTTLYSINSRKKEFGIRISQGSTLYGIANLIFSEILITNIISSIIVILPFKVLETYINKYLSNNIELSYLLSFDFKNLLQVFMLVLATTILSSIIPIKKIAKLNIVDLLKGDR
ncbi:FtsX-like permease family protein [Clostridium liquoris]|jgi:ABC-type antimicrobial peptide transport system permease subunit|uniref:FtsX-like permease family protein n=1 Tax=Clostridium liquoris TaxID=1289519 RepID=A0A2T0B8L0_9CLOT|nr:ABC transporter permease [Clostridium liquoris]PRR80185.1 FtsX-like permease family protein [Clostridium liquoris]